MSDNPNEHPHTSTGQASSAGETSKLVTIYQFAEMSSLGVRTLERMDAAGQLPRRVPIYEGKRLLRLKRWTRRSVEDWIQRRAAAAAAARAEILGHRAG